MRQPDWFTLLEQWKVRYMGNYGVTLPFLTGALDRSASRLLKEIVENAVTGYVTEVRWCAELEAPTFSIVKTENSGMEFKSFKLGPDGKPSVGFSEDLQSMFGLNCKDADDCLKKLIDHAASPIGQKRYSRNRNLKTNICEWGSYTDKERQFIKDVIGHEPV